MTESNINMHQQILEDLRRLKTTSIVELKQQWRDVLGRDVPPFAKRGLFTQILAWELQAKAFGGLSPILRRQLLALGSSRGEDKPPARPSQTPTLRPGVKLLPVWKGVTQHVMVTEDGFEWQNRSYKSLSAIARAITGTPWSGPVFLGLKKSKLKSLASAGALLDGEPLQNPVPNPALCDLCAKIL